MSDFTLCNYCALENLRAAAADRGERIVALPSSRPIGGVDTFTLGIDEELPDSPKERERYRGMWFGEVTDHCECTGPASLDGVRA